MTDKKELRQAENTAKIEGIVEEVKIEERDINGKPAIAGEIDILVNEDTHTVNVFSYKYKQDGTESGLYSPLVTVMNEYKSIKKHGKDEADKVRITQGQIGLNDYYGQDGKLRSFPQLSTNFINRIQSGDEFTPKAEFTLEMVVRQVKEEMKNEEETGRVIISGYVPVYGNRVIPFDVVVDGEKAVNYVTTNYEKGTTVTVHGEIVNKRIVTEKVIEAEFGDDKVETTTTTVREYLVKGGSAARDEDDEKGYTIKEIKEAIAEREKFLEEKKKKSEEKKANNKAKNDVDPFADSSGFGSPVDIDDSDLPF